MERKIAAENFVPAHDGAHRVRQALGVQLAAQSISTNKIISVARLKLIEKPQPLLSKGKRRAVPVTAPVNARYGWRREPFSFEPLRKQLVTRTFCLSVTEVCRERFKPHFGNLFAVLKPVRLQGPTSR
jgi:hypothetical protein